MVRSRRNKGLVANVGAAVASFLVACSAVAMAAPPAGAQSFPTELTRTTPVTWTDEAGRQYLVASTIVHSGGDVPTSTDHLVVGRSNLDGSADATWGQFDGVDGVRELSIDAPAADLTREETVAVDDQGVVTLSWRASGCGAAALECDRWLTTVGIDGTGAESLHLGVVDGHPIQGLADGSLVTRRVDGSIGWMSATGADQGAPAVEADDLGNAAVDSTGKLLVVDQAGAIIRWPVGGPADLTLSAGCDSPGAAVGAGPSGRIVAVCGGTAVDGPLMSWWESDGTSIASGRSPVAGYQVVQPTRAALDSKGRVWFAATAVKASDPVTPWVIVGEFDLSVFEGTTQLEYERAAHKADSTADQDHEPGGDQRGGITDLRPYGDGRVAVADHQSCCTSGGTSFPADEVHGTTLPVPPKPPQNCSGAPFDLAVTPLELLAVFFTPCADAGPTSQRATGYIIRQTTAGGSTDAHVSDAGHTGIVATSTYSFGVMTEVDLLARNDAGTTPWPASTTLRAVFPWSSTTGFARSLRPLTLGTPVDAPPPAAEVATIDDRSVSPSEYLAGLVTQGIGGQHIEPIARLYRASFLRLPDKGGLDYWVDRHRNGTRLAAIAGQFARSSEFQHRYGSLTNAQFVDKVYRNVFGRAPDASGLAYWTKRLDTRKLTRGGVMAQFSESSEFKRKTQATMGPLAAAFLMNRQIPTAASLADWAAASDPLVTASHALLVNSQFVFFHTPH